MSKEEKMFQEFTRRLKKMGKHIDALHALAKADDQRVCLDEIGQKVNWLSQSLKGYFPKPKAVKG